MMNMTTRTMTKQRKKMRYNQQFVVYFSTKKIFRMDFFVFVANKGYLLQCDCVYSLILLFASNTPSKKYEFLISLRQITKILK